MEEPGQAHKLTQQLTHKLTHKLTQQLLRELIRELKTNTEVRRLEMLERNIFSLMIWGIGSILIATTIYSRGRTSPAAGVTI